MNPGRLARIRQLFEEAAVLPEEDVQDYLASNCDDEEMRQEVESLLGESAEDSGSFEKIADEAIRSPLSELRREQAEHIPEEDPEDAFGDPEQPGQQIGPYKLVRLIGEGGFGTVWEAWQEMPVKRRVAIKFLKVGMATREISRRFEAERQALAMMGHPGIAQVYDAGATDSGRSYFVMEFVEGIPLIRFCEYYKLSLKKRLELFCMVCDAIQHAHQRGIVHRDIKPNNILVRYEDGKTNSTPILKIIDFGVAKVLRSTSGEQTMVTGLGQIVGTPAYMSPEQASFGVALPDTRTDVYSLGVLLYELLTSTLPFGKEEFKDASILAIQKIIQTKEPQRPSSRVAHLKDTRLADLTENLNTLQVDYRYFYRTLHTDLDWIVMKCLEKEQDRRYASAHELQQDIHRFQNHDPLVAGPPTAAYRLGKLIRRYRRTALAAGFAILAFLLGFAGTVVGLVQARQAQAAEAEQRRVAEERSRELEVVTSFQQSVFERLVPEQIGAEIFRSMLSDYGELLKIDNIPESERLAKVDALREDLYQLNPTDLARQTFNDFVLKRSSQAITERFSNQPKVEIALRRSLAQSFRQIGLIQEALDEQQRILELSEGMGEEALAQAKLDLASTCHEGKFYPEAKDILEPLLADAEAKGMTSIIPKVRFKLGQTQYDLQDYELAEVNLKQAHQEFVETLGKDELITLEAELESIMAMRHFDYAYGYNALQISTALARTAIGLEPLLNEFMQRVIGLLGEDHPLVWKARIDWIEGKGLLSWIPELKKDENVEAEDIQADIDLLNRVHESQKRILGASHPQTLTTFKKIVYLKRHDFDPEVKKWCIETYESILEEEIRTWGENHKNVAETLSQIASFQHEWGFPDKYIANIRRAIGILEKVYREPNVEVADLHNELSIRILYDKMDAQAALEESGKCLEIANAANAPVGKLNRFRRQHIQCLIASGKVEEAESVSIKWDLKQSLDLIYTILGKEGKRAEVEAEKNEKIESIISDYKRSYNNAPLCLVVAEYYFEQEEIEKAKHWLMEAWECSLLYNENKGSETRMMEMIIGGLIEMELLEEAREWMAKWEAKKDRIIQVYPTYASRSPGFPYDERNPYFGQEAYLLISAWLWDRIGDKAKVDDFVAEYLEFRKMLKTNPDTELLEAYQRIMKTEYPGYAIRSIRILAERGYWEEAEWLLTRGDKRMRYWVEPEAKREAYQLIVDFYEEWHKADPEGGHMEKARPWQKKIEAINAGWPNWKMDEQL